MARYGLPLDFEPNKLDIEDKKKEKKKKKKREEIKMREKLQLLSMI